MGSVTGNFTSEAALHPAARSIFLDAIDKGWADPAKLHSASRDLDHLINESKALLSKLLGVDSSALAFLGEPSLGHFLAISGLTLAQPAPQIFFPTTARQEVLEVVRSHPGPTALAVDLDGSFSIPAGAADDLLVLPTVNCETGAISPDASAFKGRVFVDATASPLQPLPENWNVALWDSRSWSGPAGLGILAIRDGGQWMNPLPHLDHRNVPGTFNPALAIASAVALDGFTKDLASNQETTRRFNGTIRRFVTDEIGDVDIASPQGARPEFLSFSFLYVDALQLVDMMNRRGFAIDSGSACTSSDLEPSHVLAAMGRLTHGNVRIRLHSNLVESEIHALLASLKDCVEELRQTR
jgi:cysteine desulfurase